MPRVYIPRHLKTSSCGDLGTPQERFIIVTKVQSRPTQNLVGTEYRTQWLCQLVVGWDTSAYQRYYIFSSLLLLLLHVPTRSSS